MVNQNATRHTLSVLVDNASGVLSQVSRLFSRKGYNIEPALAAYQKKEKSKLDTIRRIYPNLSPSELNIT